MKLMKLIYVDFISGDFNNSYDFQFFCHKWQLDLNKDFILLYYSLSQKISLYNG